MKRWMMAVFLGLAGIGAARAADSSPAAVPIESSDGLPFSYLRGEPLRIGNTIQFLMDDYMVEDRWKLTRRVGTVVKHLRNPVLVRDQPWEDSGGCYPSVLFDPQLGKYRMWYECFNLTNYFTHHGPPYYVGYAESDDGFNWTKPHLEGFPFAGYPRTNVVSTGREGRRASGMQVLLNPDQSDPKKRFLMVYHGDAVDLAFSPDGLPGRTWADRCWAIARISPATSFGFPSATCGFFTSGLPSCRTGGAVRASPIWSRCRKACATRLAGWR